MRIFCSICKDTYLPGSDVQVTNCGHLYHATCISTWIKQHRTCPQCRAKLSQPIKIYFDFEKDTDADVNVLEHQVQSLSDKLCESEKNVKSLEEEKINYINIIQDTKENNEKLKNKSRILKESIRVLKEQVTSLKRQNESLSCLKIEVNELKNKVTALERVDNIIKGSADEVNKMLENTPVTELAVKHLCTYVSILKIQLEKSEAKYVQLDKVLKTLTLNIAEEKRKNSIDSDLVNSLKSDVGRLELQLLQTRALFKEYKKKHPEKIESNTTQEIPRKDLSTKNVFDIDMELDESVGSLKQSRGALQLQDFANKMDLNMEIDENLSRKEAELNKTINRWEEFVSAGPSTSLRYGRSKSFIKSSFMKVSDQDISSSGYAFDGLGGRKKLRLGAPTPKEEFEMIKRKKNPKFKLMFQHKKIVDFCQVIE